MEDTIIMYPLVDEATEERARIALRSSPIHALRTLQVSCEGDALIISGRVPTFYYKQLAQEAVRTVIKDVPVVNNIEVD